jgi:hypothetical protein
VTSTSNWSGLEAEQLAKDWYVREGYLVTDQPHPSRDLGYDFIASKGDEKLYVQVRSRASGERGASKFVPPQVFPDGKFIVHFVGRSDVRTELLPAATIRARLAEPAALFNSGHEQAAILSAATVFEAAARRALILEGDAASAISPQELVRRLISRGLLPQAMFFSLASATAIRNAAAHGGLETTVTAQDLDAFTKATELLLDVGPREEDSG